MFKRQFTSVLSAIVLAVHMLVGCCAHHEHDEVCAEASPSLNHAESVADHTHHHDDADDPAHDHQHSQDCGHGPCVFVVRNKNVLPTLSTIDHVGLLGIETTLDIPFQFSITHDLSESGGIMSHLRSHLSKSVLRV